MGYIMVMLNNGPLKNEWRPPSSIVSGCNDCPHVGENRVTFSFKSMINVEVNSKKKPTWIFCNLK